MSSSNNTGDPLDDLTRALQGTKVSHTGVSFAGKSLKLDTENDAKPVIEEIDKCSELEYLNLEGNTLGVDAAKAVAKSLEKHPEFKRALWKDMFTGRMKTEIPKALEFLGQGLVKAGARLRELDLSDNAFGPIGVQGLAALLRSSSCYALEELRLNNNGLGITGGKLLAAALTDCYNCSKKEGKPLALKVFIAGRNRLENEGAKSLAEVFKMIGTLEEVAMPQNGIYHVGITALSEAFTHNKNLQILNLNDNTIGAKGAEAIAKALPSLQQLKQINFGDCLLKTRGAISLAKSLTTGHMELEDLVLDCNEIKRPGGIALVLAMANKSKLKTIMIDGNQFGSEGADDIRENLQKFGKLNTLGTLEENESEDESEESENSSSEESQDSEDDDVEEEEEEERGVHIEEIIEDNSNNIKVTAEDFLKAPSAQNFLALEENKTKSISAAVKMNGAIGDVDLFVAGIMKVASLSDHSDPKVSESAGTVAQNMLTELFLWAQSSNSLSVVANSILVHAGLIKSEDKKFKPTWNLPGCIDSIKKLATANFCPQGTKDILNTFLQRPVKS